MLQISKRLIHGHPKWQVMRTVGSQNVDNKKSNKQSDIKILTELSKHLWPSKKTQPNANNLKGRVVLALGLLVSSKIINIQVPFIFKDLIDNFNVDAANVAVLTNDTLMLSAPIAMVLGYGIARSTAAGMAELRSAVFSVVAHSAIRDVAKDVFTHLHKLDLQFHLDRNTGVLSRIIDRGSRSINFALSSLLFNVVPTALEVALVTGILAHQLGPQYAAVAFTTVGAYTAFTVAVSDWRTEIRKAMNKEEAAASGKVVDSLINYETVKYFGTEDHEANRYDESLKGFQLASIKTQTSLSLLNFGQNAIFSCGLVAMMCMTTQSILAGTATMGDLVLVNGLLFQLSIPLNFIGSVYRELRQATVDMEALFRLRGQGSQIFDNPTANPLALKGGLIEFKDLRFAYPSTSSSSHARTILGGVSFSVPAGKTVAIVGSSGSGKSTIFRLLYRFYDPTSGSICIDGQEIKNVTMQSLRANLAVVPQDTVLFNDTLGYNIRYGDMTASEQRVAEVIKLARLDSLISRLPEGLNTKVGERGLKLSGGEKQRVAIARCLLKDSPIVLLDEATSSLDAETEQCIQSALRVLGEERTVIIIAHRLSTVQNADCIVVLEQGEVVEQGTHEELLVRAGRYAELVTKMQQA